MARPPRLQTPGSLHHIFARGNEKREVFRDDTDRNDYLDRIARYREQFGFRLYAFCLMSNHFHLAVEQGTTPLSVFLHALQSSYTQYFNRRHRRVGHLFQGRYNSLLVDGGRYFFALIDYIHQNPVKAGLVGTAEEYRWSSARYFLRGHGPPWLDLDRAIGLLGWDPRGVLEQYRTSAIGPGSKTPAYDELPLSERSIKGDEAFADAALRRASLLPRRRGWTADAVVRAFTSCEKIELRDLAGVTRQRRISRSRALCAYVGREWFGVPISEFARLYRRNETTLARAVRRLRERLPRDEHLKGRVLRLAENVEGPLQSASSRDPRAPESNSAPEFK